MSKEEKRSYSWPGDKIEVRESDDGKPEIVMTVPYNSWSHDLGGYREMIKPGFFADSIKAGDIQSFFNHERSLPMGRQGNSTLRFEDSKSRLKIISTPPDTQYARDYIVAARDGYIEGTSFTFMTLEDSWKEKGQGKLDERILIKGDVMEFSPVTIPAYPKSAVTSRSLLAGAGIDIDKLAEVFEAKSAGRELDADGQEVVRRAMSALTEMLPKPEAEGDGELEGQESVELLDMQRQMDEAINGG